MKRREYDVITCLNSIGTLDRIVFFVLSIESPESVDNFLTNFDTLICYSIYNTLISIYLSCNSTELYR
jgi:hypothetical protein